MLNRDYIASEAGLLPSTSVIQNSKSKRRYRMLPDQRVVPYPGLRFSDVKFRAPGSEFWTSTTCELSLLFVPKRNNDKSSY